MCNVQVLLTQGLECLASPEDVAEESLIYEYIPVFLLSILCAELLSYTGSGGHIKYLINFVVWFPAYQSAS